MPSRPLGCLMLGMAMLLPACGAPSPGNGNGAPPPPAASATTTPAPATTATGKPASPATQAGQLTDSGSGKTYRYAIHYPSLPAHQAPLAAALRVLGDRARRDFLAGVAPSAATGSASYPWELALDFRVAARTADFVSVIGQGSAYTGGAHGNPILLSVLYDLRAGRTLDLGDLFADPAAGLHALAQASQADLLARLKAPQAPLGSSAAWIGQGTAPTAGNYRTFAILPADGGKARGLRLLFPPYQVASYADGTQQVDVPAANFAALLKPAYAGAFDAGTH